MTLAERSARAGADIGGTFTDLIMIAPDGRLTKKKVPSTTNDYAQGILNALDLGTAEAGCGLEDIRELVHGTTVATNAVLELAGARVGLITTRGFRDVLELRRLRMPMLYRQDWQKPPVLVDRMLRREVDERTGGDGSIVTPLDLAQVEAEARALLADGAEAIAVMFLNSYANPAHENAAAAHLRQVLPDVDISVSTEILPEMQEYERTSTAVVNAYVQPKVRNYVTRLTSLLASAGMAGPVRIMQSSGGIIPADTAVQFPVRIIESGPAAGVIACQRIMTAAGYDNVICFDMGGTTAKASLVEDGRIRQATEYEVGGGVSSGSRLSKGGGYVIRVPSIDIAEVGAGGGSLVSIDMAGGLRVGPQSAGSVPGPVAYGNGNEVPTVTDANITLGYINPTGLAGGSLKIDGRRSRAALEARVVSELGLGSAEEAAFGVHIIANATMIRALRAVTIEQGRDPSDFVLCAFGGSGPIHAAHIARAMEISRIVIPPSPGLFSAFGLLMANIEESHSRTVSGLLSDTDPARLDAAFAEMETAARARLAEHNLTEGAALKLRRRADVRYVGQTGALTVDVPEGALDRAALDRLALAYADDYRTAYGFVSEEEPVEVVTLRLTVEVETGLAAEWLRSPGAQGDEPQPTEPMRRAYFGPDFGSIDTPVIAPGAVGPEPSDGPAILEGYDSTVVIPPQSTYRRDDAGNIVIDLK